MQPQRAFIKNAPNFGAFLVAQIIFISIASRQNKAPKLLAS
jgi:hypothetical protein